MVKRSTGCDCCGCANCSAVPESFVVTLSGILVGGSPSSVNCSVCCNAVDTNPVVFTRQDGAGLPCLWTAEVTGPAANCIESLPSELTIESDGSNTKITVVYRFCCTVGFGGECSDTTWEYTFSGTQDCSSFSNISFTWVSSNDDDPCDDDDSGWTLTATAA